MSTAQCQRNHSIQNGLRQSYIQLPPSPPSTYHSHKKNASIFTIPYLPRCKSAPARLSFFQLLETSSATVFSSRARKRPTRIVDTEACVYRPCMEHRIRQSILIAVRNLLLRAPAGLSTPIPNQRRLNLSPGPPTSYDFAQTRDRQALERERVLRRLTRALCSCLA